MKKRVLAMVLACGLVFSMTACGSTSTEDADAVSATESETETASEEAEYTFMAISAYGEGELPTDTLEKFLDLVEEKSEGKITFDRQLNGSFCTIPEEFDYVSSGSVDVHMCLADTVLEQMNLFAIGAKALGQEESWELFKEIYIDNEETAELAQGQAADNNVIILGSSAAGTTVLLSPDEVTSFEDFKGTLFGTTGNDEVFTALGFNVQRVEVSDFYDSLEHGLITTCSEASTGITTQKYYECAGNALITTVADSIPMICFNLDSFNSLPEDLQEVVREAAIEASEWSVEQHEQLLEDGIEAIEAAGGVVNYASDEDNNAFLEASISAVVDAYGEYADAAGYGEAFDTIIEALSAY